MNNNQLDNQYYQMLLKQSEQATSKPQKPSFYRRLIANINAVFNQKMDLFNLTFLAVVFSALVFWASDAPFIVFFIHYVEQFKLFGLEVAYIGYSVLSIYLAHLFYKLSDERRFIDALLFIALPLLVAFRLYYVININLMVLFIFDWAIWMFVFLVILDLLLYKSLYSKNINSQNISWVSRLKHVVKRNFKLLYVPLAVILVVNTLTIFEKQDLTKITVGDQTPAEIIKDNTLLLNYLAINSFVGIEESMQVEFLKTICKIEMANLGIDNVNFEIGKTDDETGGYYSPAKDLIVLSDNYQKRAIDDVIKTIAHECYHAYQHRCAEYLREYKIDNDQLLMFKQVKTWRDAHDYGIKYDIATDRDRYMASSHEYTARLYSTSRIKYYQDLINIFGANFRLYFRLIEPGLLAEDALQVPTHLRVINKAGKNIVNYYLLDEVEKYGKNLGINLVCMRQLNGEFIDFAKREYWQFDFDSIENGVATANIVNLKEGYYKTSLVFNKADSEDKVYYISNLPDLMYKDGKLSTCLNHQSYDYNKKYDSNNKNTGIELNAPIPASLIKLSVKITDGLQNDYDKARALHDWLCEKLVYNKQIRSLGEEGILKIDSFSDLQLGNNDISVLYHLMLNAVNIPSRVATGNYTNVYTMQDVEIGKNDRVITNHAWNHVYIKELGRWIMVDVSGDVQRFKDYKEIETQPKTYRYFAMPPEEFANNYLANGFFDMYDNAKGRKNNNE